MQVLPTRFDEVKVIQPDVFSDFRGFFLETFEKNRYQEMLNIDFDFVQDNHSHSKKNILRGLHFQKKYPQGKIVRVVRGEIFDVAVDIRQHSPTFGQWEGIILSEENKKQLWIPPGFAHGFLVLSEFADFEYKCTNYYHADDEGCLLWNDPDINIHWPLLSDPILSEKDHSGQLLTDIYP